MALRATSEIFHDTTPIWKSPPFPIRFECELIVQVPEDRGVHLREIQGRSEQPGTYDWIFRASPQEMPEDDSRWLLARLSEIASEGPAVAPVELEVGTDEPAESELTLIPPDASSVPAEPDADGVIERSPERAHTRIQWKLATLGRDLGLRA